MPNHISSATSNYVLGLALDFIRQHRNADEIVIDTGTGLPVRAVYSGPDCTGNYRTEPAVFEFDACWSV